MASPPKVYVRDEQGQQFYAEGDEEVYEALRQGYSLDSEQPQGAVYVNRGGKTEALSPEEAQKAILSGTGRVSSLEEMNREEIEAAYDNPLAAGVAGLARGATFGLSDQVAASVDPSWAEDASQLAARSPTASTLGELGGGVATLLATGGASALGRGATAGVTRLGGGALASRIAGGVASGAAEGAAIHLGKEVSQAALESRQLDSDKILQAIGAGLVLGGVVGGAIPLTGAMARNAVAKIREVGGGRAGQWLDELGVSSRLRSTGGEEATIARLSPEGQRAAADLLETEIPAAVGERPGTILTRSKMAEGVAAVKEAAKAELRDSLAVLDSASAGVGPRMDAIASRAREEVLTKLEGGYFTRGAQKELRDAISDLNALKDYRVSFTDLNQLSTELRSLAAKATDKSSKEAYNKLSSIIDEEIQIGAKAISERAGIAPVGDRIAAASSKVDTLSVLEDAIAEGIKKEASALRLTLSDLTQANALGVAGAHMLGPVGGVLGNVVGSLAISTMKKLGGLYGEQVVAAAARDLAAGSPARLAGMVDGLIARSVGKALTRETVDAVEKSAVVQPKPAPSPSSGVAVSAKRAVGSATQETVAELEKQVRAALFPSSKSSSKGERSTRIVPLTQRVSNARSQVDRGGATPEQTRAAVESIKQSAAISVAALVDKLEGAPPDVAAVLQGQIAAKTRAAEYLLSKVPVSSNLQYSLTPQAEGIRMSKSQVDELVTAARVVADPLSVLESLEKGTLSRVEVEALRVAAPQVYDQVVANVQAALADRATPLPYKEALQLSSLLGIAGDPSLDPATMVWLQQGYASQPSEPPPSVAPRRKDISVAHTWFLAKEEE